MPLASVSHLMQEGRKLGCLIFSGSDVCLMGVATMGPLGEALTHTFLPGGPRS